MISSKQADCNPSEIGRKILFLPELLPSGRYPRAINLWIWPGYGDVLSTHLQQQHIELLSHIITLMQW